MPPKVQAHNIIWLNLNQCHLPSAHFTYFLYLILELMSISRIHLLRSLFECFCVLLHKYCMTHQLGWHYFISMQLHTRFKKPFLATFTKLWSELVLGFHHCLCHLYSRSGPRMQLLDLHFLNGLVGANFVSIHFYALACIWYPAWGHIFIDLWILYNGCHCFVLVSMLQSSLSIVFLLKRTLLRVSFEDSQIGTGRW